MIAQKSPLRLPPKQIVPGTHSKNIFTPGGDFAGTGTYVSPSAAYSWKGRPVGLAADYALYPIAYLPENVGSYSGIKAANYDTSAGGFRSALPVWSPASNRPFQRPRLILCNDILKFLWNAGLYNSLLALKGQLLADGINAMMAPLPARSARHGFLAPLLPSIDYVGVLDSNAHGQAITVSPVLEGSAWTGGDVLQIWLVDIDANGNGAYTQSITYFDPVLGNLLDTVTLSNLMTADLTQVASGLAAWQRARTVVFLNPQSDFFGNVFSGRAIADAQFAGGLAATLGDFRVINLGYDATAGQLQTAATAEIREFFSLT